MNINQFGKRLEVVDGVFETSSSNPVYIFNMTGTYSSSQEYALVIRQHGELVKQTQLAVEADLKALSATIDLSAMDIESDEDFATVSIQLYNTKTAATMAWGSARVDYTATTGLESYSSSSSTSSSSTSSSSLSSQSSQSTSSSSTSSASSQSVSSQSTSSSSSSS